MKIRVEVEISRENIINAIFECCVSAYPKIPTKNKVISSIKRDIKASGIDNIGEKYFYHLKQNDDPDFSKCDHTIKINKIKESTIKIYYKHFANSNK